jgi:hypothetical protein
VDQGRFEVSEASRRNHRIYYRVKADGAELPSLVCIFESYQHTGFQEELMDVAQKQRRPTGIQRDLRSAPRNMNAVTG